jgi:hypothetical protein
MRARDSGEILNVVVGVLGEARAILYEAAPTGKPVCDAFEMSTMRERDTPQRSRMTSSSKDRDNST